MTDYPTSWRVISNYVAGEIRYQACRQTRALRPGEPVHSGVLQIKGLYTDREAAEWYVAELNCGMPVHARLEYLRAKAEGLCNEIVALADDLVYQSLTSGPVQGRLDDARLHSAWLIRDLTDAVEAAKHGPGRA